MREDFLVHSKMHKFSPATTALQANSSTIPSSYSSYTTMHTVHPLARLTLYARHQIAHIEDQYLNSSCSSSNNDSLQNYSDKIQNTSADSMTVSNLE